MKALSEINKGNIENVYLFYGEEAYKRKVYKNALKKQVPYGNQMNYAFFEGKDIDFQAVYDSAVTLPFFAEKRLVIVENSGKFQGKKKAEESTNSDGMIEKILQDLPETTCLAFFEESALKNKKIFKAIASKGCVEECKADSEEDICKWIRKGFKSYQMGIDPAAARLLIDRAGTEYTTLLHEIEKLASYAAGNQTVTTEDVLAVTTDHIESKIFEIMSYMSCKNTKAVLHKYYDMLANKEDPRMIMAMIRRQFRIMLQVAELSGQGLSDQQISERTGNKPFVIKKMRPYLRNYSREDIIQILAEINRIDMQTKNGDLLDQIGVELLLISASS